MTYHAPLPDMSFALKYGASLLPALEEGFLGDLTMDDVEAVLGEAGRMAAEVLAPLDRTGDRVGASIKDGVVTTAPGWKEAYDAWRKGGWNGLASPAEWGGQGLPQIVNAACTEMWNGACMAFGVGPLLTMGAIDALNAHGSDALKRAYLEKLVTGEWTGTMHLTEPQAGSDVGALRTRAERAARRHLPHHRAEDIHHLRRARPHRQHHSLRAGAAAGRAAWHARHFVVSCSQIPAECRRLAGRAQRCARAFDRAQARHPRLADLHHGVRRSRRRHRLSDRRRECRHGLHVHHDEQRAARGRPARRRHRRARHAAGDRLCARAQTGPHDRHAGEAIGADHRASGRQAHADDHARPDAGRAQHLLRDRAGARSRRARHRQGGARGRRMRALRCSRHSPKRFRAISASK